MKKFQEPKEKKEEEGGYMNNQPDLYYNSSIYPYYEYLIFNNMLKYLLYYLWINLFFYISF